MPFQISDLKEHNSELLKLLTQNLPDMLWVKDLDGIYMYVNQAICDGLLMAKDTDEPIGKNDMYFAQRERKTHSDKPNWHTFGELCFDSDKTVVDNDKAMKFEEHGNIKGELLYLEVYKAPFYDKNGKIIGTVGAGRDITEIKKIQLDLEAKNKILAKQREQIKFFNIELERRVKEEIEKQQNQERLMIHQSRQAAMGEMLESIAHQWRQPLNIIGVATASLETQYLVGTMTKEDFHKKMEIVASNINYMSNTIDDFRNFLNPNREMINFSLEQSIKDVLAILDAQIQSNKIINNFDTNCCVLFYGVENEFKQVLFILLNNAIDAIKIEIEKGYIEQGSITVTLSCKNNQGIIDISDNGGGIDSSIIESIFDAYFTTKGEVNGSGIGLYIAKSIIESRMKGSLSVKNIKDGSSFIIVLPLAM
ncbi:MAG: PAS domain-containing sensor histidine kinase [Campylobacterota bacterium]|nr:PAS domain-containing sensor histidine kinase [Campylobacterota bacterium]